MYSRYREKQLALVVCCAFLSILIWLLITDSHRKSLGDTPNQSTTATPTPGGIVAIQGNNNMGRVQLLSMSEVIDNTNIRAWHDAGWTGYGRRIGVLDQGFGGLLDFEAENNTSVALIAGADRTAYDTNPLTHGADVLMIINAIAPRADLYACAYLTYDEFVRCIDWMLASDVNIINHSAGVPALPLDGTNEWAREVDRAAYAGALWVNAAGNFANGYISDFFTDRDVDSYHEFRGVGEIEALAVNPIGQTNGRVMLSWEESEGTPANEIDFDLEIIDTLDNVIAASINSQQGNPGDMALEWVQIEMNSPFGIRIRSVDGYDKPVRFVLFVEFASLPGGEEQQSIIAPGDSLNALTVGAQQGNVVAPYSSRGPLLTGALKPNLVAPGEILLPNGHILIGTSYAAPVVAGTAALIWEANPSWIRQQVFNALLAATQDDSEIPGPDSSYGRGRLYLPIPQITPTPLPTPTATQHPTPALPTPILEPTDAEAVPMMRGGEAVAIPFERVFLQTGIDAWHAAGWTGADVRVGVVDLGFKGLSAFEQDMGIEIQVSTGVDKTSFDQDITNHGVHVIEIVHRVAPRAELYAYRYDTLNDFRLAVTQAIAADIDIIVHSAGVPSLPLDGNNAWALEVDRASRAGILWVNAAGNFNGGYLSETFTYSDNTACHHFQGTTRDATFIHIEPVVTGQYGVVALSWDDVPGAPRVDLNLIITDDQGKIVTASQNPQNGETGQRAEERASFVMDGPFNVIVKDNSGNALSTEFVLFVEFADLPGGSALGSVIAPGDSSSALTVGALANETGQIAEFSSRGVRNAATFKPDLVTIGGIELQDGPFLGTSAAAPVVAGAAALYLEAHPSVSRGERYTYMRELATMDDSWVPGRPDNIYGFGTLYMLPPVTTPTPSPTSTATQTPTPEPPTLTPEPTDMPFPTFTSTTTPTGTPTPTNTSTSTSTLTVALAPSETPTNTPTTSPTTTNTSTSTVTLTSTAITMSPTNTPTPPPLPCESLLYRGIEGYQAVSMATNFVSAGAGTGHRFRQSGLLGEYVDFVMGATLQLDHLPLNGRCGFVFRRDNQDFYSVKINREGEVIWEITTNRALQAEFIESTDTKNRAVEGSAELALVVQGFEFYLCSNDRVISHFIDSQHTSSRGSLALVTEIFESGENTGCAFSDIWVWDLNHEDPLSLPGNTGVRFQAHVNIDPRLRLNVRSSPKIEDNILGQLENDAPIRVIGRNATDEWLYIECLDDQLGWVSAQYIDLEQSVRELPFVW